MGVWDHMGLIQQTYLLPPWFISWFLSVCLGGVGGAGSSLQ